MKKAAKKRLLATDVGGVLKEHRRFPGDEKVRWVPKSKWALKKLCKKRKLYIISYVRPGRSDLLRKTLRASFVPDYIPEKRWHFVHSRPAKIDIMKKYGIPTLIDDRPDIIGWVEEAGLRGILFRGQDYPDWKHVVHSVLSMDSVHLEDC